MEENNRHITRLIQVPSLVVDMKPKADRSWKLSFETRELTGDEVKLLAENLQGQGWLVFKPNADSIVMDEIPATDADAGVESPSSRLRKRIYLYWKQRGEKGSFDAFYWDLMQKFMEFVEERLN